MAFLWLASRLARSVLYFSVKDFRSSLYFFDTASGLAALFFNSSVFFFVVYIRELFGQVGRGKASLNGKKDNSSSPYVEMFHSSSLKIRQAYAQVQGHNPYYIA